MAEIKCCEDCVHIEVCAMCVPPLPICDSFKDRTSLVKVVRCKDCKHWWKENNLCVHPKCCDGIVAVVEAPPTHFCAYGERKDDES